MTPYVLGLLFGFFVIWLVFDAIRIFNHRRAKKSEPAPAEKTHSHNWRKITPFAKQCKDCKTIEVAPNAPEGLEEYLKLLASAKTPKESLLRAEEYKFHDQRMQGWTCPKCKLVIPRIENLPRSPWTNGQAQPPRCPYCEVELKPPIAITKEWLDVKL